MLFPYRYVPHKFEKMQEFIDYIFYEVWCKAPENSGFSLDLFNGNTDLREIMTSFYYDHTKSGDLFFKNVELIHGYFAVLSFSEIETFKRWYQANNDIEAACLNTSPDDTIRYSEIPEDYQHITDKLGVFYKALYNQDFLGLAIIKEKVGVIGEHYKSFIEENSSGKCPFCGIGDIKGNQHTKREAYDHYLPKGLYPFNSINLRNLTPACHECNSTYKLAKDPLKNSAGSRKAFYPYTQGNYRIEISMHFSITDIEHLDSSNIHLQYGPSELAEEIETWKDLFGIEERYKAKCCSESDGKAWLVQVLEEWAEGGQTPEEYLRILSRYTKKRPFVDCGFLKNAFLKACDEIGVFKERELSPSST